MVVKEGSGVSVAEAASAAERMRDLSYSQQYDLLFQGALDVKKVRHGLFASFGSYKSGELKARLRMPHVSTRAAQAALHRMPVLNVTTTAECPFAATQAVPKPSPEAQAREDGARKVWLSDVFATAKSPPMAKRRLQKKDWEYVAFMAVIHGVCLLAPATFSWPMVGLFFVSYFITGVRNASAPA